MAGIANPAGDALIEKIATAESREELTVATRALDRVLRSMHVWIPQWYKGSHNIAYLDMFARPYTDTPPPFGMGTRSIWWYDEEKAQARKEAGAF